MAKKPQESVQEFKQEFSGEFVPLTAKQRVDIFVEESATTATDATCTPFCLYLALLGELGEAFDYLKKVLSHGKTYDRLFMAKEIGDYCWYLAAVQRKYGRNAQVGIEPYYYPMSIPECAVSLGQQTAAFHDEFMVRGGPIQVTERINRCISMAITLFGELEIMFNGRAAADKETFDADMVMILDLNKEKLEKRYPNGFSQEDAAARKDVVTA